jgi:hypothetical protein
MSSVRYFERINSTDARVTWNTTWTRETATAGSYGMDHHYRNVAGSWCQCAFYGTRVKFIAPKVYNEGYADIYIDGAFVASVDMYASPTLYRQEIFDSGTLAVGSHTIRVVVNGTVKNPSSAGYYVCVDCFDVYNATLAMLPYSRIHATLGYTISGFTSETNTVYFGGSRLYTNATDARHDFAFFGNRVVWLGRKGSGYGIVEVFLDGVSQGTVDCYQESTVYLTALWDSGVITNGVHFIRIRNTGTKNPSSTGTYVVVNAFDVYTSAPAPTEDVREDPFFAVTPSAWTTGSNAGHHGGTMLYTNTAGALADVDFYGNRIQVYGYKDTSYGHMTVNLDGTDVATADLYATAPAFQQLLWDSGELGLAVHRLRLTRAGTKNEASSDYLVDVDYLCIFNPAPSGSGTLGRVYPPLPAERIQPALPTERVYPL